MVTLELSIPFFCVTWLIMFLLNGTCHQRRNFHRLIGEPVDFLEFQPVVPQQPQNGADAARTEIEAKKNIDLFSHGFLHGVIDRLK